MTLVGRAVGDSVERELNGRTHKAGWPTYITIYLDPALNRGRNPLTAEGKGR
ncbi:hypothetical protein PISMIDRAFT_677866 [Pisolithus microcarpus 441]|uniref:Uncharacterized protein n=1 Tax=Pisolithus microcarpus 441 TaxID=765257 RepID=A0A0C9ZR71_9AGAM|nr:hypothetical protein PISMIDRAFT_677866 [Pisolithus microcarpus 441]